MDSLIRIEAVEQEGDDGLIVTFSDGMTVGEGGLACHASAARTIEPDAKTAPAPSRPRGVSLPLRLRVAENREPRIIP